VSASGSEGRALLTLARPLNGILAAVAVVVGAFVSMRTVAIGPALLGAAAAFAASSGANAFNDWTDREADSINRPSRPIPSGQVTPHAALVFAALLYAAAVACAVPLGPWAVGLAGAWVGVTLLYSRFLSGVPLLGNVVVAIVASSPFVMGGISQLGAAGGVLQLGAAGGVQHMSVTGGVSAHGVPDLLLRNSALLSLVPAGLAFPVHLAREIVKDAEDRDGDARVGARTFAVLFGQSASLALARLVVIVLMVVALLPYGAGLYGRWYLAVVVPIEVILAWRFVLAGRDATTAGFARMSRALKVVMVLGLVAVTVGVL